MNGIEKAMSCLDRIGILEEKVNCFIIANGEVIKAFSKRITALQFAISTHARKIRSLEEKIKILQDINHIHVDRT